MPVGAWAPEYINGTAADDKQSGLVVPSGRIYDACGFARRIDLDPD